MNYKTIKTEEQLITLLENAEIIEKYAFQNLNFTSIEKLTGKKKFTNCLFLGCELTDHLLKDFENCLIFPQLNVPYNVFINQLYNYKTLFGEYELGKPDTYSQTFDQKIYTHFMRKGLVSDDINETLARSLHDHSISDALSDFLKQWDERKIVGIMGGHSILRTDNIFFEVALLSKKLTEKGYLMVSGGGPGAMEATHLGAWFAGKEECELQKAISILSQAPAYTDENWLDKAMEVLNIYPDSQYQSLGIPTWHYGHEPSTPFASHIAKYFTNSIREDGILTIAKGGIIFTPGSAGTLQEIFQEAAQNHYLVFDFASPMAFYKKDYWTKQYPIYPLLNNLQNEGKYKNLILSLNDSIDETINEILKFTES